MRGWAGRGLGLQISAQAQQRHPAHGAPVAAASWAPAAFYLSSRGSTPPSFQRASSCPQAKDLLKKYGGAYLLTSISFAIVSFAACYAAVSSGGWVRA